MGDSTLNYTDSERDLGILMNRTHNFSEHSNYLYNRSSQRFGILKWSCHFVYSILKRRVLYSTMVRSLFEHYPVIWRPSSDSAVNKLDNIQKRALKWINQDSSNNMLYFAHCKQIDILPVQYRFDFHDLKLPHQIAYNFSCIYLPAYLHFYDGSSRLRSTHLDHLSLVSDILPGGTRSSS